MAGVFYKHLQNPIEYTLQLDPVRKQDKYYMPGNFGNADNYGLELDFIKFFNKFGIKGNYTYTHSSITTKKFKRIRDEQGNIAPSYPDFFSILNACFLYCLGSLNLMSVN